MKKVFAFLSAVLLTVLVVAQSPEKLSFQAVIRDINNNLVTSSSVGIRVSILQGTPGGLEVYKELFSPNPQTNANGLLTIEIGAGIPLTGTFAGIDWSAGPYFIKTEVDPTGGTNYTVTGTTQLLSVPYALHAKTADSISGDITETDPVFTASVAGGITGTDTANWNNKLDSEIDGSVSNELQTLSISNDTLYLTNGGFVKLPAASGCVLLPPTATTHAATNVQMTTASMNGTVNANGLSTTVVYEWGLTTSYGSNATASQSPVTGASDMAVSANLTSLQNNTTYHYRIKATNAVNITYSSDMSFTTTFPVIPTVTTSNFSDLKGNSAKAGGNVTNDGGSTVTAQGLCWSTSPNPTTANGVNTSFTAVMSVLSPNTVYYVRAYATNIVGTGYGNQISFNSGYVMGSTYSGGLVFYNDGAAHGLVCASTDQSAGAAWGCYGTAIGCTLTAINTGATNTNAIVLGCTTAGIAAKLCYDLVLNTYNDWYLPAKDELTLMYVNLDTQSLGGFASAFYWSSSEVTYGSAWMQGFSADIQTYTDKNISGHVRAIRAF